MKSLKFICFLVLISCNKIAEKKELKHSQDLCFQTLGLNYEDKKPSVSVASAKDILKSLPKHVQISDDEKGTLFLFEKEKYQGNLAKEKAWFISEAYKAKFKNWLSLLDEFNYLAKHGNYALAKNKYGMWLIEKTDKSAKPYFLGLTQNFYIPISENENLEFIKEENIVLSGSLLLVERLSRYPIVPKYTVIKDRQLFSVDLNAVKKDTDGDGYNDLFEDFIGINANSKDTDSDGTDDFNDLNPRFKSETSKLTEMYAAIADEQGIKKQYSFTEILTDCPDFQNINPKNQRFLFYNTSEQLKLKNDVLDQFFPVKYSKIQRPKNQLENETYFMDFGDGKGDGNLSAEYINGKWKITRQYNLKFGM